jgi:23S rRNA pseudouridine1911/1915/1917 synthase
MTDKKAEETSGFSYPLPEAEDQQGGIRQVGFTVAPNESGVRLDLFFVDKGLGLSRTRIAKIVSEGMALVNGRAGRVGQKLKAGQRAVINIPAAKTDAVLPEDIPLNIVYEDDALVVVDKPAGMVVHPAAGHYAGTLVNALLYHCRDLSGIGGVLRPGIVHRLDKETSGLLVAAKSDKAHLDLAGQFKRREVKKTYEAVVFGRPNAAEGKMESSLGRHPADRKKMSSKSKRGRSAITIWRIKESYGVASLLDVFIETGRTHQIRVHLADMGCPVVGDRVYGNPGRANDIKDTYLRAALKRFPRQALHACRLSFRHPVTGEKLEFFSGLPDDIAKLCDCLREKAVKKT